MSDPSLKGWERLRELVQSVHQPGKHVNDVWGCIGVEVGVSRGWTSEHLLREFPGLYLWMVDYWGQAPVEGNYAKSGDGHAKLTTNEQQDHKDMAIQRTEFASVRHHVWHDESLHAATLFPEGQFDFAFLDARHDYEGVKADLEAWAPKVRKSGLIILHDLDHPRDKRGLWGVRKAAEEFAAKAGLTLQVDSKATMGWMEVK